MIWLNELLDSFINEKKNRHDGCFSMFSLFSVFTNKVRLIKILLFGDELLFSNTMGQWEKTGSEYLPRLTLKS